MSTNKGQAMHKATNWKECSECHDEFTYQIQRNKPIPQLCPDCRKKVKKV